MTKAKKYDAENGYVIHHRWANLDKQAWQDAPCVMIKFLPEAVDRFVVEVERAPLFMEPFKPVPCFLLGDALRIQEGIREQIEVACKAHRAKAERRIDDAIEMEDAWHGS